MSNLLQKLKIKLYIPNLMGRRCVSLYNQTRSRTRMVRVLPHLMTEREREREREEALASVGGVIALAPAAQSLSLSEEIRTHLVSLLSASSIETEE